ncbi:MAG: Cof-type HAD-IIB family hydrolase [Clostridiales bacterium]|jgi:hydroxymethylpyrimidine pyrophosphatase-like HAD family hydrolase|nr:Cof-type HAD-IIB family hydrolase [Clostridiales bacterium]
MTDGKNADLKYKLIACDFDGTLLRGDNTISDYTRAVIAEYIKRGGVFMPATGRMHTSIKRRMADIGLYENTPIASYQGAMIRENLTDKALYYKPIANALALEIALEAERLGLYVQAYDYDELVISALYDGKADGGSMGKAEGGDKSGADGKAGGGLDEKPVGSLYGTALRLDGSFGRQYAERLGIGMRVFPRRISEYICEKKIDCVKLLGVCKPDDMPKYLKHFADKFPAVICNVSEPYMLEIIAQGTGKDVACDVICGRMGIGIDACMAFGDSMNDYTMIAHAGLGVAMSNGREAVKDAAKYVTGSNDGDGVAKAIERFCL